MFKKRSGFKMYRSLGRSRAADALAVQEKYGLFRIPLRSTQ